MLVFIGSNRCSGARTVEPDWNVTSSRSHDGSVEVVSFDSEHGTGDSTVELSLFFLLFDRRHGRPSLTTRKGQKPPVVLLRMVQASLLGL